MNKRRAMRCTAVLAAAYGLAAAGGAGAAEESAEAPVAIALAPFETVAPEGSIVPDLATLIADRLGTRGVQRVVGPAESGAPADTSPAAEQVVAWAKRSDVDAVVVGRTTVIGRRMSIDLRVRDGETGAPAGTYVVEVADPEELPSAVEKLSDHVLEGARRALSGEVQTAAVSAPGQRGAGAKPLEKNGGGGGGLLSRDRGPLDIRSDELEAIHNGDRRKFVFTDNVRVSQGSMRLRSHHLEAFYPPGQSEPDRLVATGNVRIHDAGRDIGCKQATYVRADEVLFCRGEAEMEEDGDVVHGEEIELHLRSDRIFVRGNARVQVPGESSEEEQ